MGSEKFLCGTALTARVSWISLRLDFHIIAHAKTLLDK